MIDLSHLTEEEQGAIMMVLRRDLELKKSEGERVRKLEKVLNSGSQSDSKLKYLTGEWFYEAKSRRHTDKIHGSDIILASMKQRKAAGLDGSLRLERSRIPSSRASDSVPPSKPARCLEATQPQQINDAEKENVHSGLRSPRTPRHNPFNRASLVSVEPSESNSDTSPVWDQVSPKTELASPLKNPPRGEPGHASAGSVASEGSSAGFRPVPKKRTFLSRRTCSQSDDAQFWPEGVAPAPRRSLQQDSSGSSNRSRATSRDDSSQQPLRVSQVSSNSSLDIKKEQPSTTRDRLPTNRGDESAENETAQSRDAQAQGRRVGVKTVILPMDVFQDSGNENISSVVMESSTQSIVAPDPPVSYDLNFIDNTDQQAQYKSNPKHAFRLSTQATSPTGDDEDSIAKVLDWFNRSMDSSDWLKTQEDPRATKSSEKHAEINNIKNSLRNDTGDIYRREESLEKQISPFQRQTNEALGVRGTDTKADKQQNEEMMTDIRGRMQPQDVKDNDDDWQSPKISHLKSFWEKSNNGPKILISKSVTPSDSAQSAAHHPAEKDEESVNEQHGEFNMPSGINTSQGNYDKHASDHVTDRDQKMLTSSQTDKVRPSMNPQDRLVIKATANRENRDPTYTSQPNPQDGRGPDPELSRATRLGPQSRTAVQSGGTPEYQSFSSVKPSQQPYTVSQFQKEQPSNMSMARMDVDIKTSDVPLPEKIGPARNSLNTAYNQDENDAQVTSGDMKRTDPKDSDADQQGLTQGSTAQRIKQLRSFWEQEMNKPMFYNDKPKTPQDSKFPRGANRARLNKRFTKSEYDLRSVGNDSDGDAEDPDRKQQLFTVLPLSQRIESLSPSLSVSRTNFTTLREFWGEAAVETKAPSSSDKPKPPKRKEAASAHVQCQEFRRGEPEVYSVDKTRPAMKSPPPPQNRSKLPHNRQSDGRTDGQSGFTTTESKRNLKEFTRGAKLTKPQISSGKETRSGRGRKDSFGNSSSHGSLRRAVSMFALGDPDQKDQCELKVDVSPVRAQGRKERQSKDKGASQRRASGEMETQAPLARAFVPRDYRHYLGMTDSSSVHASLAPAEMGQGSEGKSGYDFDLSSPVRASTPVCSEERYSKARTSQRPLWASYSSSDTGQESSLSSTSNTRSISRNTSNCENDNESHNPVRKALKRAEARPRNLARSLEDITASSSARQERRPEPPADLRRIRDVSTISSNSSSLFSDPDHLKKMSKSVPSSLQKEDADIDTDSTFEDHRGELTKGRSMSNLTNSSGMSSLSGSVATMYSGDFGNIEVQGNIQFSINYIQRLREFHIFVVECRDLAAADQKRARSDPYVKSYLVPDKDNLGKRKTSVKKKTLNPTFNEILRYRVRMEELRTQTLILSVWHHDTFGRNSFLGEVDVDLSTWDFDRTQMNYLALKPRNILSLLPSNDRGEMRLAIRFLPQITCNTGLPKGSSNFGEIHIWVKECKNLPLVRATIDPYVKCFVLPDTSRKSRQKTRVLRRTADPVFNHTMVYDGIREVDLTEACVELTVWDRDRLASSLLGGLRLGSGSGRSYGAEVDWMDSTSYEVALWERMMASLNEWVEGVLPLRMLNCTKAALK